MTTLAAIRERIRSERLDALRVRVMSSAWWCHDPKG